MSNKRLAPQSRAEILDRCQRFRAISKKHNSGALKHLSTEALLEQARRLGIARGRQLILNNEDEFPLLYDLALYARRGGRQRPLDRYAAWQRLSPDSEEARVLEPCSPRASRSFASKGVIPRRA